MAFYELDLLDSDGVTVSVAAVDQALWNAQSAQITALATAAGFSVQEQPDPPAPGTYERNLYAIGDVQGWLASQSTAAKLAAAAPGTGPSGLAIAGALAAGVLSFGIVWLLTRPRRES
jgi:hypothetical protein